MATHHVLLIDDDQTQLTLLQTIAARQRPTWSVTGLLADEALITTLFNGELTTLPAADLLVCDRRLGTADACDLLPDLCQRQPVVLISGRVTADDQHACTLAGAAALCAKPYDLTGADALFTTCDAILAGRAG